MSRTERNRWTYVPDTQDYRLDRSARDSKAQCWCCSKWKRPARRSDRFEAKAKIRRDPEGA